MENNIINKRKVDVDLLKLILGLQAESRKEKEQIVSDIYQLYVNLFDDKYIKKHNMDFYTDEHNNLHIVKGKLNEGEFYNCIVSHSDQVCKYDENKKVFQNDDYLFAQSGPERIDVGADDLTGVYACFQTILDFDKVKVIIFASEEIGCIGSSAVDLSFFSDCKFIAQFDRRGNTDFINHTNGVTVISDEFKTFVKPYVETYKYKFETGTCTDVGTLVKRDVGISSFNLSCGYYNAHSKNSYQSISELETAYNLFYDLCINSNSQFLYKLSDVKSSKISDDDNSDIEKMIIKDVIKSLEKTKKQGVNNIIIKTIKAIVTCEFYVDFILRRYEEEQIKEEQITKYQLPIWQNNDKENDDLDYDNYNKSYNINSKTSCVNKQDCFDKHGFIEDYNDRNVLVKYCGLCYDEK